MDEAFDYVVVGAGTTLFWVDPELDMSFVGLTTGVMNSDVNLERWQRLCERLRDEPRWADIIAA